jgi:hypothetical protein
LVVDNLNIHCQKSLTKHFGPERGAQLWNRFTVHYELCETISRYGVSAITIYKHIQLGKFVLNSYIGCAERLISILEVVFRHPGSGRIEQHQQGAAPMRYHRFTSNIKIGYRIGRYRARSLTA